MTIFSRRYHVSDNRRLGSRWKTSSSDTAASQQQVVIFFFQGRYTLLLLAVAALVISIHFRYQGINGHKVSLTTHPFWKRNQLSCQTITSFTNDTYATASVEPNPPFQMSIHDTSQDNYVSASISQKGCFECDMVERVQKALVQHPNSYLLDVGGNIGMYSLAAAAVHHEAFAIEPSFGNYRRICLSTVKNEGFEKYLHVLPFAATEKRTQLGLDIPGHNKGGTKVVEFMEGGGNFSADVEGMPIDDFELPSGDRSVVLKVDVEGHEMEALAGAKKFICNGNNINSHRIVLATMEIRGSSLVKHSGNALEIFHCLSKHHGLVPFAVKRDPEVQLDPAALPRWIELSSYFMDVMWYPKSEMIDICKKADCIDHKQGLHEAITS